MNWLQNKVFRIGHRLIDPPLYWLSRGVAKVMGLVSPKWRHIWLVSEMGVEAHDNGYHFFRYLRQTRPDINAYFLISPDSPDYARVAALGPTVAPDTVGHYLRFGGAEMLVSTHVCGYTPTGMYYLLDRKINLIRGKKVLLKHGIVHNYLDWCYAVNCRLDLFVCGAKREWEALSIEAGFPEGVVRYLGLCRYDRLMQPHETKKQLLVMPTWRRYASEQYAHEDFPKTPFYQRYQSLLNSEALHDLLMQYGYTLVFYPHKNVQPFLEFFTTPYPEYTIAAHQTHDVQDLLMESAVLLTDYSSVFFDFGYLQKPLVYYQFDQEMFRSTHYRAGYFSYEGDGFGPVVKEEAELLAELEKLLRDGVSEMYRRRIEAFFPTHDDHNCARNLEATLALLDKH